ncbi:MAG: MTH1187 family thiamine-binding protein [Gemmatimonadota bacterium]|jgi:uncharacterized protein (TIGR00106 family)|nr:MTH1187 family thiamine-binding protein [Gemmatimonadota bacterium]
MLVQISVTPLGTGTSLSDEIAEVLRMVDESGLPYLLTPSGTCIEGAWDEVMPLVRRCHERMREMSPHVVTTLRIEDQAGQQRQLTENVRSVEEKVGRRLQRIPDA